MTQLTHDNFNGKEIHPPHRWEFPNATLREGFLGGYSTNLCVGGTVTASGGYTPEKAFDGDITCIPITKWTTGWYFSIDPSPNQWIQYAFSSAKVIRKIILFSAGVDGGVEEWVDFVLSGSNNGTDFTQIHSANRLNPGVIGPEEHIFSNNAAYTQYRLTVNFSVGNGSDGAHIIEIQMMELYSIVQPVSSDLRKLALQLDDFSYWSLKSTDPIIWSRVFRILNPIQFTLQSGTTATLSNGNLTVYNVNGANWNGAVINIPKTTGKWYFEFVMPDSIMFSAGVKAMNEAAQNFYAPMPSISYLANHIYQGAGGGPLCPTAPVAGSIMAIAYDIENHNFKIFKDGVEWFNYEANPTYYLNSGIIFCVGAVALSVTINPLPTYEIPGYNFIN